MRKMELKSSKGKSANKKIDHQLFKTIEEDLKKLISELKKFRKGSHKSKKHERDNLSDSTNNS